MSNKPQITTMKCRSMLMEDPQIATMIQRYEKWYQGLSKQERKMFDVYKKAYERRVLYGEHAVKDEQRRWNEWERRDRSGRD